MFGGLWQLRLGIQGLVDHRERRMFQIQVCLLGLLLLGWERSVKRWWALSLRGIEICQSRARRAVRCNCRYVRNMYQIMDSSMWAYRLASRRSNIVV